MMTNTIKRGKLLVFEGPEACGKSTALKALVEYLNSKGYVFETFREPGGVIQSEDIRSLIMKHEYDATTEAMLFAASRNELMKNKIIPLLDEGVNVILDRFVMSSLCYQGYCGGVGLEKVLELNKMAIGDYMPDMNILLDIEPERALARLESADREINRFDTRTLDFHNKVREGYLHLSQVFESTFTVVNADQIEKKVLADVISVVEPLLQ